MKYVFNFKEINYGSIGVETDHLPDNGEVIDAIMNGDAYFKNTDYEDIYLIEAEDGTFFFGGYHFIPYRKFRKGEIDRQVPNDDLGKCNYSHESFYTASGGSDVDIFRCLENGKFYVPGANELFHYNKPEKKKKG